MRPMNSIVVSGTAMYMWQGGKNGRRSQILEKWTSWLTLTDGSIYLDAGYIVVVEAMNIWHVMINGPRSQILV